ncbi:SNF2 family N-terminal domain-containing protein [Trichophaea hybrida]|nr:SNF2 family N-terminal domain-containing protein [Trichophaea hybrida]
MSSSTASKPGLEYVDLTLDDDDDDAVVVTGSRKRHNHENHKVNEICYGTVRSGTINSHLVPAFPPNASQFPMLLRIVRGEHTQALMIHAYDCYNQVFGHVDVDTARALVPLMDLCIYRIQCYLYPLPKNDEAPGESVSRSYHFFFNVFGSEAEGKRAATLISQKNVFFEDPHQGYYDRLYRNPHHDHAMNGAAQSAAPRMRRTEYAFVSRTAEEVRADVNKVFDGLDQADNLPEMDCDPRIKTPLLKHQKQGLHFLSTKERERTYDENEIKNMSLWRKSQKSDGQEYYYHVITSQQLKRRPPDVLGGILADMMGLGKTLQILSLIVATQAESHAFSKRPKPRAQAVKDNEPKPPIMNAKTTLLISPLSTISNWEEQIQTHVQEGTLNYHLYHGSRRETNPKVLAEYDLVITTYQVIASEWNKHMKDKEGYFSPLQQMNFFRIVLDEAHMIREQSTLQSKAVIALHAQRRWAVTGTPVQNRLDDLAALTKFLRVKPFDEKNAFHQYIAAPLKSANDDSFLALRLLVDSITLRRQKDKIALPPRRDQIVYLNFSQLEQEIYDATAKQSSKRVDMVAKQGHMGGKNYVHILQMILRLRLICAHGRELLGDEDVADLAGLTSSNAINVDELDDTDSATNLSSKQAYQIFSLMKETNEDICSACAKKAVGDDKGKEKEGGEKDKPKTTTSIGFLTPCAHMLCKDCVPTYTARISGHFQPGMRATCPICGLYNRISFFELKADELLLHETGAAGRPTKKKEFRYRGPSTKVKALMQAVIKSRQQGTPEDPIKSVVFSGWTSHLDLIERAFVDNEIRYVRLDGSQTRIQRNAAIAEFRDDLAVEVILVSLMAGGLGHVFLNLTAACRVYVMEPQWNPAAEAQAIDRIHRLGQKKPVITVRYIMAGSFEEKILEIQKKKTDLANMTMAQGKKLSRLELSQQRLEVGYILFRWCVWRIY